MKNFSPEEKAIIIDGLSQYGARLYGAQSGTTGKDEKTQIYLEITIQVNALGVAAREPKHIRKKINDLRRLVKESLWRSGGMPLTQEEDQPQTSP